MIKMNDYPETYLSFLTYHAIEGGILSYSYARELLCDAANDGLICHVLPCDLSNLVDKANVLSHQFDS